jgi:hypothetical protein
MIKNKKIVIKRDKNGNLTKETIEALVDRAIAMNPLIYERLSEI